MSLHSVLGVVVISCALGCAGYLDQPVRDETTGPSANNGMPGSDTNPTSPPNVGASVDSGTRSSPDAGGHHVAPNNGNIPIGFYPCDGTNPVSCFNDLSAMLNRAPSSVHVTQMTDHTSSAAMADNGWGMFVGDGVNYKHQWQTVNPHPQLTISVPLAFGDFTPPQPTGASELNAVANGAADADLRMLVNYAIGAGYTNVIWRLGWEFDGDWMPWASRNDVAAYVTGFRRLHDIIKGMMPDATFDWCGSAGPYILTQNWDDSYPGDAYVDFIGMDIYDNGYSSQDLFNANALPSLDKQEAFAVAHGKQVTYPEWGVRSDAPNFIQYIYNYWSKLPASGPGSIAYANYFNATADSALALSLTPNSKEKLIELFGQ